MTDGKLRFYDKGKETFAVEDPYWGGVQSPETQLHIKEMTDPITAKVSDEDLEKVMDAAARQELANKTFEDLTRKQKIQLALEEIDWIVIGGQDGEEFYGSIQFLRKVLRSLV